MRRSLVFCALSVCALSLLAEPSAPPCDFQLPAGTDLQGAIDAAVGGDVICLDPGLYTPGAKLVVDKTVTLRGPQSGVDPRPSFSTAREIGNEESEAIIDGGGMSGIFVIEIDNVVLEGLEIRNGSGDLIDSESSLPPPVRSSATTSSTIRAATRRSNCGRRRLRRSASTMCSLRRATDQRLLRLVASQRPLQRGPRHRLDELRDLPLRRRVDTYRSVRDHHRQPGLQRPQQRRNQAR